MRVQVMDKKYIVDSVLAGLSGVALVVVITLMMYWAVYAFCFGIKIMSDMM